MSKHIKVKAITSFAGLNYSFAPSQETTIPEKVAKSWIKAGLVVEVSETEKEKKIRTELDKTIRAEVAAENAEAVAAEQIKTARANQDIKILNAQLKEISNSTEKLNADILNLQKEKETLLKENQKLSKANKDLKKQIPAKK